MTINEYASKWNLRFASNDTFDIGADDLREFKDDTALLIQSAGPSGTALAELVLPMAVTAGLWYLTTTGIWEARGSFNAQAAPLPGANWRRVADFRPTLTAASISDASEAGRSMLTAVSAAAQLALVDKLDIGAGQYGDNPAFTRAYTDSGAIRYLLQQLQQLKAAIPAAVVAPAAPTSGQVNDVSKEFSFLVNPAYPTYSQYKVGGLPGTTGPVYLAAANAYQVDNTVYVKVGSAVPAGNLSVYVAGSGNVPDGKVLVNDKAFTGAATTTPPSTALTVSLAIAVASIMAGTPLGYTVTASGGAGGYTYAVVATNTATGVTRNLGAASNGGWTPTTAGDYELTATVTDSTGASKISAVRALHVSSPPLANAGSDTVLTQPASSATLQGSGYEPGSTIAGYSWSQSAGPVSATFSSKTVAQPTVSGLTAVGDYHFQLIVTDAQGNVSLADEVVVSVQAAGSTRILEIGIPDYGDSITLADQANLESGEPTETGTTSVQTAQGTVGNVGQHTAVEQAVLKLNADPALNKKYHFTAIPLGYPGKSISWWERTHLAGALDGIDLAKFDGLIADFSFFANDPVYPDQVSDPTSPADIKAATKRILTSYKQKSTKILGVVLTLPTNRDNYPELANFKVARAQYIDYVVQDQSGFYTELADVRTQPVGQDGAPVAVAGSAPVSDLFWDAAGHPRISGQAQRAIAKVQAYCRVLGETSTDYGTGTRPGANPGATLAITPATGAANSARTASVSTSASFTKAELFQVNTQGLTYAPTLVASSAQAPFSLPFSPAASASYYVRLTRADNSYQYTAVAPAAVTASTTLVTKGISFTQQQVYLTRQRDGTMLKTDGPDDGWRGQTTGNNFFGPDGAVGSSFYFDMPAPNGQGAGFTVGLSATVTPNDGTLSTIVTMEKGCFYADDEKCIIFYAPSYQVTPASGVLARPATGNRILVEIKADGYYFTDTTANVLLWQIVTNGSPNGYPHYINAAASVTGYSRIPVVVATSSQFLPIR